MRRYLVGAMLLVVALGTSYDARAQQTDPGGPGQQQRGGRGGGGRGGPGGREAAMRAITEGLSAQLRSQVGLNDSQVVRLSELSATLTERRQALLMRERAARFELNRELNETTMNETRIACLHVAMLKATEDRFQLVREEDQAMQAFMLPSQRAKYWALYDRLTREIDNVIDGQRGGRRGGGGRGGPPPSSQGGERGGRGRGGPPPEAANLCR